MDEQIRILLADASEEFRGLFREMLDGEAGLELVGQTGDGEELLRLMHQLRPDVVVMDLLLTGMDGLEVLEHLGKERPRMLVLSAFAAPALAEQVAARGGDYCMLKPCRLSAVVERIRQLAHGQAAQEGSEGGDDRELERIASIAAVVPAQQNLSDSVTVDAPLELRDENGNAIEPEYTTLETDTAEVALTVLQVRELPLAVDFIGLPEGFDTSSLPYTLDRETLRVAGPERVIGSLTELSVASLDLGRSFAFDRDYQLRIELPDGVVSLDGVNTVTLTFDTSQMATTTLNVSTIRVINIPSDIDIEVLTDRISGVVLYGPADEIAELSPESVVAQVDCQSVSVTAGQQTLPVSIQIPASGRIFAVGSYNVQCQITAQ